MNAVDLHVHSNRSDGSFTPKELVAYALEKGLEAFALTDHDTTDGLAEALEYADILKSRGEKAPRIIPGIEFSTEYQGKDIHIVGLFIDYKKESFQKQLLSFIHSRFLRNQKMCALLQQDGIDITYDKLREEFPGSVITRAHYAKYLLNQGYVKTMSEAFEKYVGDDCPYYIPREKVTPLQAVKLILNADGVPILAHPMLYPLSAKELDTLVRDLKAAGLLGIEAIYPSHTPAQERQIRKLADKYGLLISGGSDFHGKNKPGLDLGTGYGKLFVSEDVLRKLQRSSHDKLLFSDMDGTLLNKEGKISPAMKAGLDKMTAKGHRLILSSGRPLPSILETMNSLHLTYPGMLIIANNGALIYDCDLKAPILEHRISPEDVRFFTTEARKLGLHLHAYTDSEVVCREMNEEMRYYTRKVHLPILFAEDIASLLPKGSYKLQAIHLWDRSRLEAFREHIKSLGGHRFQFVFSCDRYMEILPAAAGKGSALSFVRDYLHIPHSHTYAAGDAENDISMLEAAHTAIAMRNATDAVKAKADIITKKDNQNDGLLEIIEEYILK